MIGLGAMYRGGLVSNLNPKITLFEYPVAVGADKGKVVGLDGKPYGLRLAGLELDLLEGPKATVVGGE